MRHALWQWLWRACHSVASVAGVGSVRKKLIREKAASKLLAQSQPVEKSEIEIALLVS
jgi:hypothetical protein